MNDEAKTMHRLVVDVVAPGYRDRFVIESEDPVDLEPKFLQRGGQRFERYGSVDEYDEVRYDLVVARSLYSYEPSEPAPEESLPEGHPKRRLRRRPEGERGEGER